MEEAKPLLTLSKSRLINAPTLSEEDASLLETLSGLCGFHSSGDLGMFLFSEMFTQFVGTGETWIVFEAGVYLDHTKTVEIMAKDGEILIIHSDQILPSKTEEEFTQLIQDWHDDVMDIKSESLK